MLRMLTAATALRYSNKALYDRTIGGLLGAAARDDPEFPARHAARRAAHPPKKVGYRCRRSA